MTAKTNNYSKDKPQPDKDLSGKVKCLKCGKDFKSHNRTTNRICGNCKSRTNMNGEWMQERYGWTV